MADDLQELPRLRLRRDEEERSKEIKEEERKKGNKKMKTRLYRMSPENVEVILSFTPSQNVAAVNKHVDKILSKDEDCCDHLAKYCSACA